MKRTTLPIKSNVPVQQTRSNGVTSATVYAVDNPANPKVVSVLIQGDFPPVPGFTWPASIKTTFTEAPNPLTPPPTGGSYYINHTTLLGGTIVMVDTINRTVISASSNYSTLAPYDYQNDYVNIRHDGSYNGQWQNPGVIDRTQLANGAVNAAPTITGISAITATGAGGATTDISITFTVDSNGISSNLWLHRIQLVVGPWGCIPSAAQTWSVAGELEPQASATYTGIWHSLGAGSLYAIGVRYVDFRNNYSNIFVISPTFSVPTLSVGTTQLENMPSAIAASGPTITSVTISAIAQGSVSPQVALTVQVAASDYGGAFGVAPGWLAGCVIFTRLHGSSSLFYQDYKVLTPANGLFSTSTFLQNGSTYDIGFAYFDLASGVSAIVWPTAWNNVSIAALSGSAIANNQIGANHLVNSNYIGLYPPNTNLLVNPRFLNNGNGWQSSVPTGGAVTYNATNLQRTQFTVTNIANTLSCVAYQYFPISVANAIPFIFSVDVQPQSATGGGWFIDMYNCTDPNTPVSQIAQANITGTIALGSAGRVSISGSCAASGISGIFVRIYFLASSGTNSGTMYAYRPMLEVGPSGIPSPWNDGTGASNAYTQTYTPGGDGSYILQHVIYGRHFAGGDPTDINPVMGLDTRFLLSRHATQVTTIIQDDGTGNGIIPASTALNAQGSIPPFTTDFVLHNAVSGTSPSISLKYWLDNGTASTGVTFWRVDGSTLSANFAGTLASPISTITGLSSGDTIFFLAYFNQTTLTWVVQSSKNAQFTPAQIAAALGDGIVPALTSTTVNSVTASGGGNLKGCPEINEPIECRRDGEILTVRAGELKVGDELRDFEPEVWNRITHFSTGPAPIHEVWFLDRKRPIKVDSSHLFMTPNEAWINVQNLRPGTVLAGGKGELTVVSSRLIGEGMMAHITCERSRYLFDETSSHNFKYF